MDHFGHVGARRTSLVVAAATAVTAAVALVLAVTTPPRSGAFCTAGCVGHPYTDVAAFLPRDYWWMYPGLLVALLFVALATCLAFAVSPARRLPAAIGTGMAGIGAAALVIGYAVQLMVMQPALLAGETDGLSPWSQYDPHGVFIALENLGYALFGAAFVLLGLALRGLSRQALRLVRMTFLTGGALVLAALVVLAGAYGAGLDVRFEVAGLSLSWLVLVVTGALLTRVFATGSDERSRPAEAAGEPVGGAPR